jgi:hypothetical protein
MNDIALRARAGKPHRGSDQLLIYVDGRSHLPIVA